ncbi:MAG TPA: FtsX-like permease family protein [Vicinamibacterales bacterium]|nr:FtsX-like permease family protein [Vicinamibacterales bacterium]
MTQYIDYSAAAYRATALLAGTLAFVGLVLTTLGVYGVIAYRTARRAREFGVRIALGGARGQVLLLVLKEAMQSGVLGIALGIPIALTITKWLSALLFGVGPWDPRVFLVAPAVVIAAVCFAAVLPAWRAMRVDPASSLRSV